MPKMSSKSPGHGSFQWHPMHDIYAVVAAIILFLFLLLFWTGEVR